MPNGDGPHIIGTVGTILTGRLARACVWGSLALFLLVAAAVPYLHHDFACHDSSPFHCPACTASQIADKTLDDTVRLVGVLRDAGEAASCPLPIPHRAPTKAAAGRSPPSVVC